MTATTHPQATLSVIGGGTWGLALAAAAHRAGTSVLVHSRRMSRGEPGNSPIRLAQSLAEAASFSRLILLAIPSGTVRTVARELGDHLNGHHVLVHGVRGLISQESSDDPLAPPELETISAVLRQETPVRKIGALGGPVLVSELAAGEPSVLVVGARFTEVGELIRQAFTSRALRVYPTDDLVGLEWASALTAILAVAVGFARGMGLRAGVISGFIVRAVHEAARIAVAAGAEERTFMGLGGFGDLLAAIAEEERPEVRLGEAIARGEMASHVITSLGQKVEAVELAPKVAAFAARRKVRAPIFSAIGEGLFSPEASVTLLRGLMENPVKSTA